MQPVTKNERIQLAITAVSSDGAGVGRAAGMAVFVPGTAAGDVAEVQIIKVTRSYAVGKLLSLISASPERIPPDCEVFSRCGGCVYRHISYREECRIKQARVADALRRINGSLGFDDESYHRALAASMLVSCDNAHAVHPNHAEKCDARNQVVLNGGIVIKEAANQHYCTDAFSRAVFQAICDDADVPTQAFANKSDMAGGSTLGNLSNMQASMHAVDVGLPQLAMHSSYETGGVRDVMYAIRALTAFYERNLTINGAESVEL